MPLKRRKKRVTWVVLTIADIVKMILQCMTSEFDFVLIIEGKRGLGKCQVKGDRVLMHDGSWKNVEDIKVGDIVLSPQEDGSYIAASVKETHSRFEEEIYDIKEVTREQRTLYRCAWNHEIPIMKSYSPRIKGDYQKRGKSQRRLVHLNARTLSRRYTKDSHYCTFSTTAIDFNNPAPEIDAYTLGYFIGNGHFIKDLGITTRHKEAIEYIKSTYPNEFLREYRKKGGIASTFRFSVLGRFSKQLIGLDFRYKHSGDKFIPKEALLAPIEYRLNLLAGLIDSDGYVMKDKDNHIVYTTKSSRLAENVKDLVFSLGGYASIRKIKKKCQNGFIGEYFNISISCEDPQRIPLKTSKKQRLGPRFTHNPRNIAINCIKSEPSMVYGFEIDSPSKWYITNNWIVTHNSTLAWKLCRRIPGFNPKENIIYSREEVIRMFATKKYSIIWPDELINVAHNRDFFSQEQATLIKLINMYRDSCNFFVGCVPYFVDLDTQMRKLVKMRIQIIERGFAVIHLPMEGSFSKDPWQLKECERIEKGWEANKPQYMQLPTAIGFLRFGDLSEKERLLYKSIKQERRNRLYKDDLDPASVESNDPREKLYFMLKNGELTKEQLETTVKVLNYDMDKTRAFFNSKLKKEPDPSLNTQTVKSLLKVPEAPKPKRIFKLLNESSIAE